MRCKFCVSSLQVSYTGTKSYNSSFHDTGSWSVSGETAILTGLTPDTNYSIVVIATNTAGFRNSSDAVVGATLPGCKCQSIFFGYVIYLHLFL